MKVIQNLKLPILLITIIGSSRILPKGTIDLFPGKVTVHPPIDVTGYNHDNLDLLMEEARKKIVSALPRHSAS